MAEPSWALQQGLYLALSGYIGIPVFDDAPQSATRPYCFIGDDELETDSGKVDDEEAWLAVCEIEIIDSTHRGRKVVKAALAAIHARLHNQPLIVDGFTVNWSLYQSSSTSRSDDGLTYRAVTRYQIRLQQTD